MDVSPEIQDIADSQRYNNYSAAEDCHRQIVFAVFKDISRFIIVKRRKHREYPDIKSAVQCAENICPEREGH